METILVLRIENAKPTGREKEMDLKDEKTGFSFKLMKERIYINNNYIIINWFIFCSSRNQYNFNNLGALYSKFLCLTEVGV